MFRHIIHLHIPAFPIAVARVCRPDLRDRPVAMAPPHSERALILSVSSEARREGVFKGMPLGRAVKFCPHLAVLPPDPGLVERAFKDLVGTVARYTPVWEPSRPGHVYLDVTGTDRLWGRAKDTAGRLRQEIKTRLGLPGTAGVAGNKMVSSIASRVMPAEGVLDVDHGLEGRFIAPLKADVLPGIGRIRRRILLEELHITLVREIAAMDRGSLRLVFGRQAVLIHQRALGIDPSPVCPPPVKPTLAEEITLPMDENDDERLLGVLYGLVEKCGRRLRERAVFPRRAGLLFRHADHQEVARGIDLPGGTFRDLDLYAPLERLFLKTCRRRVRVRFMRVWFSDFSHPPSQLSLFPAAPEGAGKGASVTPALDRIREKYGDEAVRYARTA